MVLLLFLGRLALSVIACAMPPLPKGEATHHRGQIFLYLGLLLAPPLGELASGSETERAADQFSEEISCPKYFSLSSFRVPSVRSSSMALLMASSRVAEASPLRRGMATWEASSV